MQIVGFKWKRGEPIAAPGNSSSAASLWQPWLFLANGTDAEEPARLGLWNGRINVKLGIKHCVGHSVGGRHYKCPDSADVGLASTCTACKQRDDWFGCIQCTGEGHDSQTVGWNDRLVTEHGSQTTLQIAGGSETSPVMICNNPKQRDGCMKNRYWVYLAAFDGLLKVGCSYERRFFERMIEQGADFGCRLGIVQDGGYARALEQRVARYLGLPDKIHGAVKQAKLFGEPNKSVVEIAKAIAKMVDSGMLELKPETFDFRQYYRLDKVSVKPRPIQLMTGVRLVGDVVATKGNIVVMKTAAGMISFDTHRLVGYDVELGSSQI